MLRTIMDYLFQCHSSLDHLLGNEAHLGSCVCVCVCVSVFSVSYIKKKTILCVFFFLYIKNQRYCFEIPPKITSSALPPSKPPPPSHG